MERSPLQFPPVQRGYDVSELQAFLAAADRRTASLQEAIAAVRAQLEALEEAATLGRRVRDGLAEAWLSAHADAEATRQRAAAEADAIVTAADAEARAILARTAVRGRDDHLPAGAGR